MGFRLETHFKLFFEDEAFIGAEVTMGRMSTRETLELDKVRFRATTTLDEFEEQAKDLAAIVAKHLISWNLEDKAGKPLPCTARAILDEQDDLLPALVGAYVQAVRGVPAPLALSSSSTGSSSNDGSGSEGLLSIPMEPLSESL